MELQKMMLNKEQVVKRVKEVWGDGCVVDFIDYNKKNLGNIVGKVLIKRSDTIFNDIYLIYKEDGVEKVFNFEGDADVDYVFGEKEFL